MKKIMVSDIDKWPERWANSKDDLPPGRELMGLMKPFFVGLISSSYSSATIRRHVDNLFMLGRYLIDNLMFYEKNREIAMPFLITHYIDSFDGPRISAFSQDQQSSFDGTCRKYYAYLVDNVMLKIVNGKRTVSGAKVTQKDSKRSKGI